MVDAEKIERMCQIFESTSSMVNYAIHKDESSIAHIWHGADTACRMIIGGEDIDDFEVGVAHGNSSICSKCIQASPSKFQAFWRRQFNIIKSQLNRPFKEWLPAIFVALFFIWVAYNSIDRRTPQEKYDHCMIEGNVINKLDNDIYYSNAYLRRHCRKIAGL